MNLADRIDSFFDWGEHVDTERALAQDLPGAVDVATRQWWAHVIGRADVLVDCDDDIARCAIFASSPAAHAAPQPAMLVTIDWWQLHGRSEASALAARCLSCVQAVDGRAR